MLEGLKKRNKGGLLGLFLLAVPLFNVENAIYGTMIFIRLIYRGINMDLALIHMMYPLPPKHSLIR